MPSNRWRDNCGEREQSTKRKSDPGLPVSDPGLPGLPFINDGGVGVTNYGTLTGSIVNNGGLGFSLYQNATCTADISGSGQIVNDSTKSVTLTGNLDNFFGQLAENPGLIIIPS